MSSPFPLMFHPTLIVDDLEEAAAWFRKVFGRTEVRWEDKWDLSLLNPDYPVNYSYFFVIGDVSLDVLAPSLLILPGEREAVYPKGQGLADIAWYADDIEALARRLEQHGFRTRDQEGNVIRDGKVPESSLVADCPMIWSLPEDTGLTYEYYHLAERHRPKYSRLADPRLAPGWKPGVVDPADPLGVIRCSHHTVLTEQPERAVRLFEVLGGDAGPRRHDALLDADVMPVRYAGSVIEFATPRDAPILDVLTGAPSHTDQYLGMTFEVVDLDAVETHLSSHGVGLRRAGGELVTDPRTSFGARWGFVSRKDS
ncbi:VOC family protein [Amycolatopsis echigonensis]|uniref:VOC family protein n=1 Tax=Amycolatopsis echigonensis TaxID=2576905 RepID=A0A8E1W674_9PSEU|nr:VOC family protein [Amycolatopsis echigonensis]MBB2504402.1 VOC family protein [Amycolatopsis echigonensis]